MLRRINRWYRRQNATKTDNSTPVKSARILLIHGAWAGAWVWDGLIKELRKLGREAEALDLPVDGFHAVSAASATESDFYDCLTTAINARPGPVLLAGHSGSGMLVTAAANAHPHKVTHGIWIAGFLIPDGRTYEKFNDGFRNHKRLQEKWTM